MITGLVAHLWQSTIFAGVAWLVALVLQKNRAQTRYWIWFTASVKFLIPFSWLVRLGALMPNNPSAAPIRTEWAATLQDVSQPLTPTFAANVAVSTRATDHGYLAAAMAVWACGFAAVAICWLVRWMRVYAVRKSARVVSLSTRLQIPVPVMVGADLVEPGIFGVFRPVLLLPEGIPDRLSQAQLDAILAHEFCHVRRKDNLSATIHMAAQAVFWFHPLTWWIGARLVEERERACDEDVLRLGCRPHDYAESILIVCKLYLSSPLACLSGVTGANLKHRMEAIMKNQVSLPLNFGRKFLLGAMGAAALLLPLFAGFLCGPALRGQTAPSKRPAFTVASVKPHVSPPGGGIDGIGAWPRRSGDRIAWHHVPLQLVALYAYGIPGFRLSGNLLRTFDETYDIDGIAEGSVPDDQLRLMFRSLLEDRFAIQVHWETKELQVYRLLVGKDGPRLTPAGEDSDVVVAGNKIPRGHAFVQAVTSEEHHLSGKGATMEQLANALSIALHQPVVDQTGLTGTFDFDVKFHHDPELNFASGSPEIVPAIQKALGLRLESGKRPFEMLVIDHVGKLAEN